MVTAHEVGLGLLDNAPVLLQVFNLVAVRCGEISAHASVMPCDDDATSSSGLLLVVEVTNGQTGLLVGGLECLGVLVLADTTKVDHRIGGENVLK